jgi:CRP-like cAMP-binding protein
MDLPPIEILRDHALFGGLPSVELERLATYSALRAWGAGQRLLRAGQEPPGFVLIIAGHVELCEAGGVRRDGLIAIVGPGDAVGLEATVQRTAMEADALPLDAGRGVFIDAASFMKHMDESAVLTRAALCGASRRVSSLLRENADLRSKRAIDRLATFLADLAGAPEGQATVRLPYEKRLLAASLGISPESLSRMFNRLRPLGVETGRTDVVRIGDVALLRRGLPDADEAAARLS